MKPLPVERVVVDATLGLLVVPEAGDYEHIYRAATGVRWNREHRAFCAFEPRRWQANELLTHIAATVSGEYGEDLHFTAHTSWQGVAPEVQHGLSQLLPHHGRR